jgi:Mce-associated membrane protein
MTVDIEKDTEPTTLDDDLDMADLGEDEEDPAEGEPEDDANHEEGSVHGRFDWQKFTVRVGIPLAALLLAAAAVFFWYRTETLQANAVAGTEATLAAKDSTVALLSYEPATVDTTLGAAARDLLTGDFQNAYTTLITDVVVPGAQEQRISAVATVPAASLVSVDGDQAVVLAFVNQTTVIGDGAPTATASTIKVTMVKIDDRWLVSQFEPV